MLDSIKKWFGEIYEQFQEWLIELLLWIPRKLWEEFLDSIAKFIEGIDAPAFIDTAGYLLSSWSGEAAFVFDLIEFNWGISLVMSAFAMRWAWSRIPFIGR